MRLNGFDLNQIVCLDALLSERNVSRAADRVHLSQSAMSAVLAQLRNHFNDPLLVRSGRRLVPTPFARGLVGRVSELMAHARAFTVLAPDRVPADVDRELKIVASDYIMEVCLADTVRLIAQSMPNLRFDILPLTSLSSALLRAGEVDLLLAGQAFDAGQPPSELLFEDRFSCVTCASHGPTGDTLTRAAYFASRHVVVRYFEYQMTFEDEEALRREGLTRPRQIAVWSNSLVPRLVCGTPMIATVSSRMAARMVERWPLAVFPFPIAHEPTRVYAYWHVSRDEDPVLRGFMARIRETLAAEPAASP